MSIRCKQTTHPVAADRRSVRRRVSNTQRDVREPLTAGGATGWPFGSATQPANAAAPRLRPAAHLNIFVLR